MGFLAGVGIVVGILLLAWLGVFLVDTLLGVNSLGKKLVAMRDERAVKKFESEHGNSFKSQAFVAGYKDVAEWAGAELTYTREVLMPHHYDEYMRNVYIGRPNASYTKTETINNVETNEFNHPKLHDFELRRIVEKYVDIDLSEALTNEEWLGGSEKDYRDYYEGGARLMADVADMDATVAQEEFERLQRDRLIAARKQGLREVSTRLSKDMKALTDARTQLFSTESVESQWEAMTAKVERSCASDDPVIR